MCGAIAADGEKSSIALGVGFASKLHGMAWAGRSDDVDVQAFFAQTRESGAGESGGFAATSSGIDDGEETVFCRGHGD